MNEYILDWHGWAFDGLRAKDIGSQSTIRATDDAAAAAMAMGSVSILMGAYRDATKTAGREVVAEISSVALRRDNRLVCAWSDPESPERLRAVVKGMERRRGGR